MNQLSLPIEIRPEDVARKPTLGKSIEYCAEMAGFGLDKELQQTLGVDKAQFSRWLSGQEGIVWSKLEALMDACGNDAPLLWMLEKRGWDLHSLRKKESEVEKQLRLVTEENAALKRTLRAM